uniref:F-box domain-containing protein n=1 Tax=Ananas comosus var. bracteatus TaxID=296719 RepID=A0A6V7P5T6_ANACO|nr:unnamed protein product [Ananas comosus var. bracteatus]
MVFLQDENAASVGRPWSNLATPILKLISSQLSPSDRPHFALTCKQWNSSVAPTYPADICPLLLNCPRWGSNVIRYYSPYFNKNFELDCPFDLSGATLCSSSNGWLMLGWADKIMLVDPFTGISYEIPLETYLFSHFGFFWDPITSKFQIFGISNCGYENVDIGIFDGESCSGLYMRVDYHFGYLHILIQFCTEATFIAKDPEESWECTIWKRILGQFC